METLCEHGINIGMNRVKNQFFVKMKIIGKLTHDDYEMITPMLENALNGVEHPNISLLIDATEFEGWSLQAVWDDLKLGLKHNKDFHKIALIGNKSWQEYGVKISNWFSVGSMEYFENIDDALARLIKGDDVVPPGAFIDISKKIKYYHQITRAMLIKSFEDFGNRSDIGVSINLTIEDIANIRTFNLIIELLSKNKHNHNITFELVESDGIEDYELFNKFVTTVKNFGAKISIDDFGTGYSNFSYLSKIEPNFLKIDGSLIKNIENLKDFNVVKTIIDFAKMYNILTVAEFVENEDIYILVKELGIDYSQGYYFSKPLAIENI